MADGRAGMGPPLAAGEVDALGCGDRARSARAGGVSLRARLDFLFRLDFFSAGLVWAGDLGGLARDNRARFLLRAAWRDNRVLPRSIGDIVHPAILPRPIGRRHMIVLS